MDYIVNTPCGTLQGCYGGNPGVAAYKGIRYATAGRWEYPVQVTSWEGVYDAIRYGNCSYQPRPSTMKSLLRRSISTTTSSGGVRPTLTARTACF